MLYRYPTKATEENWLHECLCQILRHVHQRVAHGGSPDAWPQIIPVAYRAALRPRFGLRDRLKVYQEALVVLAKQEPEQIERLDQALVNQNRIEDLLRCVCDCERISELPEIIRKPTCDLFSFAFGLLSEFEIRDRQYESIYDAAPHKVCPFCGLEDFDAVGGPREDLDHYLLQSVYPFAAANLRNLAPMGIKCNERHKLEQDILWRDGKTRRMNIDPYATVPVTVSLIRSIPTSRRERLGFDWKIEFNPASDAIETWDEVFHVRERYTNNVLNPCFSSWIGFFRSWCRSQCSKVVVETDAQVVEALERFVTHLVDQGIADKAFLKAAVFRMILYRCRQGDTRIIAFMKDAAQRNSDQY